MVDLETLGIERESVILSIGAIQFDLQTGSIGKIFKINIDLDSSLDAGLKISSGTIKWWLTQKPEILNKCFIDAKKIEHALHDFFVFTLECNISNIWGNSAAFDLGLLKDAYNKLGKTNPWNYRDERCYRTIYSLFKTEEIQKPLNAHDPIVDCKHQIEQLNKIWSKIKFEV